MSEALLYGIGGALVVLAAIGIAAIRIVKEYERGVIFRLGRVIGAKGPGQIAQTTLRSSIMQLPGGDVRAGS